MLTTFSPGRRRQAVKRRKTIRKHPPGDHRFVTHFKSNLDRSPGPGTPTGFVPASLLSDSTAGLRPSSDSYTPAFQFSRDTFKTPSADPLVARLVPSSAAANEAYQTPVLGPGTAAKTRTAVSSSGAATEADPSSDCQHDSKNQATASALFDPFLPLGAEDACPSLDDIFMTPPGHHPVEDAYNIPDPGLLTRFLASPLLEDCYPEYKTPTAGGFRYDHTSTSVSAHGVYNPTGFPSTPLPSDDRKRPASTCFPPANNHGSVQHCSAGPQLQEIGVSPWGIYCKKCNISLKTDPELMKRHFSRFHWRKDLFLDYAAVAANLKRETALMKANPVCLENSYDPNECYPNGRICECGQRFANPKLFNRHWKRKNSCREEYATRSILYRTVCHRLVLPFEVNPRESALEDDGTAAAKLTTALDGLLPAHETASTYDAILFPLFRCTPNFRDGMKSLVRLWKEPPIDPSLIKLQQAAEEWIGLVKLHIDRCYSDHRAALMTFAGTTVDDVSVRETFTWRYTDHSKLLTELSQLLAFAWNHRSGILSETKGRAISHPPTWRSVVLALRTLFFEDVQSVSTDTVVVEYCISRFFRIDSRSNLSMAACGGSASMCARVLSLLRASICSYMRMRIHETKPVMKKIVQRARECGNSHRLSAMIARLKAADADKPSVGICSVDEEGNISVDGFQFPQPVYGRLVPTVSKMASELFEKIFIGGKWKQVADLHNPVWVRKSRDNTSFEFDFRSSNGERVSSEWLQVVASSTDCGNTFDRLSSLFEMTFHGFGGGSMRMTELASLGSAKLCWHGGTIHFISSSIKKAKYNAPERGREVRRELPQQIARLYLLYRLAYGNKESRHLAIFSRPSRCYHMKDAVAEIFQLRSSPTNLQIRHLWTSLANHIFSEGFFQENLGDVDDEVAHLSGHTRSTHRSHYSTAVAGGSASRIHEYHRAIGAVRVSSLSDSPLNPADLTTGLVALYGNDAGYLCLAQKAMMEASVSSRVRHMHASLPCGGGKSAAWLLTVAAAKVANKTCGMIIVAAPYKFLAMTHSEAAAVLLGSRFGAKTACLLGSDIRDNGIIPAVLERDDNLPDILFLSLDAAVKLVRQHEGLIGRWAKAKLISRLILDEAHSLFGESFRDIYEELPFLASFQVPITTLSATVPTTLLPQLMSYLNMTNNPSLDDMQVVSGDDLFGTFPAGFEISTIKCASQAMLRFAVAATRSSAQPSAGHACHVIVASKYLLEEIGAQLHNDGYRCGSVTADSDTDYQRTVAKDWATGETLDVLITTTLGIVGNENPSCRHLVLVGTLYNLFNYVQAFGRLRPKQRKAFGKIICIVPTSDPTNDCETGRQQQADASCEYAADQLEARGALSSNNRDAFLSVASQQSVRDCFDDRRCLLVAISERFGVPRATDCGVCTNCRGAPVAQAARRATHQRNVAVEADHAVKSLMRQLAERCCFCREADCDGQSPGCFGRGRCYKCGSSDHAVKQCTVSFESILNGRGCFSCLDMNDRAGYERHTPNHKTCPLKKRLRRLLIESHGKKASAGELTAFDKYCQQVYSSRASFAAFIQGNRPTILSTVPV